MLSRNDMLTTGGNRAPRARGYCTVNEPAYGFFIAGSSIKALNGVYIRDHPKRTSGPNKDRKIGLYYRQEDSPWVMQLVAPQPKTSKTSPMKRRSHAMSSDEDEFSTSEEEDNIPVGDPKWEWVFTDPSGADRFRHEGSTIVPGAGAPRWSHLPPVSSPAAETAESTVAGEASSAGNSNSGGLLSGILGGLFGGNTTAASGGALMNPTPVNEDELPWQVIAVLDHDILRQLVGGQRHHNRKVAAAMAGRDAGPPKAGSIEAAFIPGSWMFQVLAEDVPMRATPTRDARVRGTKSRNTYFRGVEIRNGWVKLSDSERSNIRGSGSSMMADLLSQSGLFGLHYNADYGDHATSGDLWIEFRGPASAEDDAPEEELVRQVGEADSADLGTIAENEPEESGVAADLFDRPFAPRVEGGAGAGSPASAAAAVRLDGDQGPLESNALAAMALAATIGSALPVGTPVMLGGLADETYNDVTGVVVTALDLDTRRQGVRLDAPFSGKRLALKPDNFKRSVPKTDNTDECTDALERSARVLGITLPEVGLAEAPIATPKKTAAVEVEAEPAGAGELLSPDLMDFVKEWNSPEKRLQRALRGALRDANGDDAVESAACDAVEELLHAITSKKITKCSVGENPMPAELRVLHGCLGTVAAAAAAAALNTSCLEECNNGIFALRNILSREQQRLSREASAGDKNPPNCSEVDTLTLRLCLIRALLASRQEGAAMEEAAKMVRAAPTSPAAALVHCKCLFRAGRREEAAAALERAASSSLTVVTGLDDVWAIGEALRMVRASKSVDTRRSAAVEAYECGRFTEACRLYTEALSCASAGLEDDKRGRAAMYANRAACHRRACNFDQAVTDCDLALGLYPRYTRALFRRAACLLEAGRHGEAVSAFDALHRVDRKFPGLSDWLVRAVAAQKRAEKQTGTWYSSGESSPSGKGCHSDAEKLSAEADHYIVLGVNADATEKQIKTAYRLMSLKFHPDREGGSTAAFQRVEAAYSTLSDPEKRSLYDEGTDVKQDEDADEEEEHKKTLREEVERKYYPEKYEYWPFGDPFIQKRARAERAKKQKERGSTPSWMNMHDAW